MLDLNNTKVSRIYALLRERDYAIYELSELLDVSEAGIRKHVSDLREEGVPVITNNRVYYLPLEWMKISDPPHAEELRKHYGKINSEV